PRVCSLHRAPAIAGAAPTASIARAMRNLAAPRDLRPCVDLCASKMRMRQCACPANFAMSKYSLSHLSDQDLLRNLAALVARPRPTTAELVAHIAEVDARRLFVPKGFACMYDYCVQELHLSEDVAFVRIRVARVARQFPTVFGALADGRLSITGVFLL